ncbi:aminotransferase class I/II-fold pyridoxal phosphate-dependent enzyme [Maribacter sp. CXY002]|uniref:aminotransferase class I/II-fold pyridoxal phosphate-dependent enzyme n=1 Tax=Maribacter luteocoastalis TaxID=3407671 RepID=UPI003B678AB7
MSKFPIKLQQKLDKRLQENAFRSLGMTSGMVDFSSNDYLGIAQNETVFSKTFQLLLNRNIAQNGATGSRLLSGNHGLYPILEEMLTSFHDSESALVFNSGYDANIGFFSAVPQKGDFIFYDEYIHASIRDGIRLSLAKSYKFAHNDLESLKNKIEQALKSSEGIFDSEIYIVTESVFSMDGDSPDLQALVAHCNSNSYRLVVDEAHSVGVYGKNGEGLLQEMNLHQKAFARIVTFGKAMGAHGAAILGDASLKQYLVNFARSLIYTTGLPPHGVATIISSYSYIKENGKAEQNKLSENITFFKERLKKLNLEDYFTKGNAPIQSCIIGNTEKAKKISRKLMDKGFNVKAIVSPTIPEGQERLRFCVHSYNSKEEIGLVLQLLSEYI